MECAGPHHGDRARSGLCPLSRSLRIHAGVRVPGAGAPIRVLDIDDRVHARRATSPLVNVRVRRATSDIVGMFLKTITHRIRDLRRASGETEEEREHWRLGRYHAPNLPKTEGDGAGSLRIGARLGAHAVLRPGVGAWRLIGSADDQCGDGDVDDLMAPRWAAGPRGSVRHARLPPTIIRAHFTSHAPSKRNHQRQSTKSHAAQPTKVPRRAHVLSGVYRRPSYDFSGH